MALGSGFPFLLPKGLDVGGKRQWGRTEIPRGWEERGSDLPWPRFHLPAFDMSIVSSQPSRNKQVAAIFSFHFCAQCPIRSITFRRIQVNLVTPLTMLGWIELCEACLGFSKSLRRVQFFLFSRFIKLSESSVLRSEKSRKPPSYRAGDELWVVGKASFYSFCVHPNLFDLLFK